MSARGGAATVTVEGKQVSYTAEPTALFTWGLIVPGSTGWAAMGWFRTRAQLHAVRETFHADEPYAIGRLIAL